MWHNSTPPQTNAVMIMKFYIILKSGFDCNSNLTLHEARAGGLLDASEFHILAYKILKRKIITNP